MPEYQPDQRPARKDCTMSNYPSMYDMTTEEAYETLEYLAVTSEEALNLVITINGYNRETFAEILYAKTGYRDFDQIPEYL